MRSTSPRRPVVSSRAPRSSLDLVGVASSTAAEGVTFALQTNGVFRMPKTSALAIAIGDKVYWDNAAKVVNKTASGNTLLGTAVEAAANPSDTVAVKLGATTV